MNALAGWTCLFLCVFLITSCAGFSGPADSAPYFVPHTLVPTGYPVSVTPSGGLLGQADSPAPQAALTPLNPFPSLTPTEFPVPVPTPGSTAEPAACQDLHGKIDALSVDASALIGMDLNFQVYRPPCYNPELRYPVVYLLHGQGSSETQWPDLGAAEAADWLITSGAVPPLMMVFPQEKYFLQEMPDSKFDQALVNVLIPYVDTNYATCAEARCRAVGGISRGAMWAVVLGLENPDLFSVLGGHSLPISPFSDSRVSILLKQRGADNPLHVYLNIGSGDVYFSGALAFHELLTRLQIPHEWVVSPGVHDSAYWESQLTDTLRWYGANWKTQ